LILDKPEINHDEGGQTDQLSITNCLVLYHYMEIEIFYEY